MSYKLKVIVVDAVQYTGQNQEKCHDFCNRIFYNGIDLKIPTVIGLVNCTPTDWIIKNQFNQFFIMTNKDFMENSTEVE